MTRGPAISPTWVASTPKFAEAHQERLGDALARLRVRARARAPTCSGASGREAGTRPSVRRPRRRAPAGCPRVSSASKGAARKLDGRRGRDEIRVVVDGVDRRLVLRQRHGTRPVSIARLGIGRAAAPAARGGRGSRLAHRRGPSGGGARRARRRSGRARPTSVEQHAEDRRAGRADPSRDERFELPADPAAVRGAEREHQPDERDAERRA